MATILVVDDRFTNREFLITLLGYKGHALLEASNGAEALEVVKARHPDLVVTDVLMPSMDGYEFVRQLRSDPATAATQVIFYSAKYDQWELQDLAAAAGVARHIPKPAPPEEILKTVDEVLAAGPATAPPPPVPEAFKRDHLRLLTDKLASQVSQVERLNDRLSTLLELGRQMALEHNPVRLLEAVCLKARELVGARYAVLALPDERSRRLRHSFASGFDPERATRIGQLPPANGLMGLLLNEARPLRLRHLPAQMLGADDPHPRAKSLLSVPLSSPSRRYGVIYFLDKADAAEFSEEDERLAGMLAAQLAIAYENALRQEQLEQAGRELLDHAQNLEQRVAERTAQLRESMQALESFAYTVAHDLRSPLRAIRSFSSLVLEGCQGCSNEPSLGFLNRIAGAANRMSDLVDDLLAYSRLSQAELPCAAVDLDALVEKIVARMADEVTARGASVQVQRPLPCVLANQTVLDQVITNLLTNALKFVAPGTPPRVRLWTVLSTGEDEKRVWAGKRESEPKSGGDSPLHHPSSTTSPFVRLYIEDNGIGIAPEDQERVFHVFERVHGPAQYAGTGIGLAIVQKGVQRMGGHIALQSAPGQGSLFIIELPSSLELSPGEEKNASRQAV